MQGLFSISSVYLRHFDGAMRPMQPFLRENCGGAPYTVRPIIRRPCTSRHELDKELGRIRHSLRSLRPALLGAGELH
jgi:hypothetical protein